MIAKIPRTHERKRVLLDAKLHHDDGRIFECEAFHISPGGARIRINERLAINSRVVLAITRSGSFAGEVRWQNENFAGIRFLEDASVVEERLRAMLG